jgi:PAS domain S-box-containing protein
MSEKSTSATSPWPVADDDTSARVRDFDWTATPLGPTEHWPECLKGAVEVISSSQVPMSIIWGPQRVLIYNEAHIAHLGPRHPRAFGRPARESWGEIWDEAEAIHRRVFTGERVTLENRPWTVLRDDVLTETFFTTYFTPIRDGLGAVAGELVISFETTDAVKARRELERSEARLRDVLESVGEAIFAYDRDLRFLYASRKALEMSGAQTEDLIGRTLLDVFPMSAGSPGYEAPLRVLETGQAERFETVSPGVGRWMEVEICRSSNGIVVSFHDIEARKQAEAALRESQARLQVAVDLVGLSVYSWDLDADIADWDGRTRAIWGVAPDVEVDRALARSALHPDDLPTFDAAVSRATDPSGDGAYKTQYRVISIDDGLERWVSAYGKTTFVDGKAARFVGAMLDITDRKRAEARLRESEQRFRRFAENSSDVLWILNAEEQRLEYLSPGFLPTWGAPPEGAIAHIAIWKDSIHPEDRVARAQTLERVVAQGESMTHEYRIVRPDGSVRWIRDTVFPIRDAKGRIGQIGGIAHDISRREALSVYVVDPDTSTREAKSALLRRVGQRVTTFATEAAFLDVAGALASGCVLVRTDDASQSRFELGRILISRRIDLPVIFETDLGGDVDLAIGAMKAGAVDVLQAPAEPGMVLAAVASALANLRQEDLVEGATEGVRARIALMSAREREVLDGLLAGGTNKTIARELGISPRTVEVHRARMMERLGAHTAPEAVMAAASAGVRPPPPRREDGR